MSFLSLLISICLHISVVVLILFWPSSPPIKLEPNAVQISLMEGAPGGNKAPSPVLGPQGAPSQDPPDASLPAPKADVSGPPEEQVTPIAEPKQEPRGEEQKPKPKPEAPKEPVEKPKEEPKPKPEPKEKPKPEEKPVPKKPEEKKEPKKPEQKKPEEKKDPKKPDKPKQDQKKPDQKKPDQKKPEKKQGSPEGKDSIEEALRKARKRAGSNENSAQSGNATERALAEARRRAGGHNGGGGGEGSGVGGGGLLDVYMGQVMMAVRRNWVYASASRNNMQCAVHVVLDADGNLQGDPQITQSSGNNQFDASAVNAIVRTAKNKQFPPPPGNEYRELDLVFNLSNGQMGFKQP